MKTFKILSIDGGGLKGIYSLHVLQSIEQKYCKNEDERLSDYFDMFCGTSTGGIIALGLANRMKTQELIDLYENNSALIFPKQIKLCNKISTIGLGLVSSGLIFGLMKLKPKMYRIMTSTICGILISSIPCLIDHYPKIRGYKYESDSIADIAIQYFGNKTLYDLNNLVCIPSYKIETGSNVVFKFPHKEGQLVRDKNISLKDVILSTTCAPTYFPVYKINSNTLSGSFVDGGIWANNPAIVGIVESLQYFVGKDKMYEKYDVLSIGNIKYNSNCIITDKNKKSFWNVFNTENLINIIFDSNDKSIDYYCCVLTKSTNGNYTRIESTNISHKISEQCSLDDSNPQILEQYASYGKEDGMNIVTPLNKQNKDIDRFFTNKKTYIIQKE
jgi:patatin-like phospholipase/acyl hydrolase